MMLSLYAAFSITSGAALGGAKITRHVQNANFIEGAGDPKKLEIPDVGYDQYVSNIYVGGAFLFPYVKLELRAFGSGNYDRESEKIKNTWQGGAEFSLLFRIADFALGIVGGAFIESLKDQFNDLKDEKGERLTLIGVEEHKLWPPRFFGGIRAAYFITPKWALEVTGIYGFAGSYQKLKNKKDDKTFSMDYKYITKKVMVGFVYHF